MFIHFRSFIRPFILLVSFSGSLAIPSPRPDNVNTNNHALRNFDAFFSPKLTSETFDGGIALKLTNSDRSEGYLQAAQTFLHDRTGATWVPTWGHASTSTSDSQIFSFYQLISGLPALNSVGRVWVQGSRITSFEAPDIANVTASKTDKTVPETAAYDAVSKQLGVQVHDGAKLLSDYFFLTSTQTATQVWAVPLPVGANAWLAYVDASTGSVVGLQSTLPLPNLSHASSLSPRIQARAVITQTVIVTVVPKPTKTVVVIVTATAPPPPPVIVTVIVTATGPAPQPTAVCPFWFPDCSDDFASINELPPAI